MIIKDKLKQLLNKNDELGELPAESDISMDRWEVTQGILEVLKALDNRMDDIPCSVCEVAKIKENKLKPHDHFIAECPKCGCFDIKQKWYSGFIDSLSKKVPEFITSKCKDCGYSWHQKPLTEEVTNDN